jgi:glutamine cyclotransferase
LGLGQSEYLLNLARRQKARFGQQPAELKNKQMSLWKTSVAVAFLNLFLACGETDPSRQFSLVLEEGGGKYTAGAQVGVRLENREGLAVDSLGYFLDGTPLQAEGNRLTLTSQTLGSKTLEARFLNGGQWVTLEKEILLLAENKPEIYTYEVLATYPHDREAFTQGLEFHGDTLYESTGRKGASTLRKVDYRSGKVLKSVALDKQYFGEGITIWNDTIAMLTWKEGMGFLYDRESLEPTGTFSYGQSREGWGLCNDGRHLFKSDGTQKIWRLDPVTLKEEGFIQTVTDRSVFNKANELEYAGGKIYANVWQKESMMIIDPKTGAIEGVVNFGGLRDRVTQHRDLDVFNGVAYHEQRGTFFVTGKNWDKLFEVRIVKKGE